MRAERGKHRGRAPRSLRRVVAPAAIPLIVLLLGLAAYRQSYVVYQTDSPVHSDGEGYYAYIPAYLVEHDPSFTTLVDTHILQSYARAQFPPSTFGFSPEPGGKYLDKYGVGTALLVVPFWATGHGIALLTGANANGYSGPEVFAAGTAALGYASLALLALWFTLRRWFRDATVALTLVAITFGTSLFHYVTWDSLFSHAFSFFAVAMLLLTSVRFFERPSSLPRALLVGAFIGLLADIRITNAVVVAALPLLGVGSLAALRNRLALLQKHRLKAAAILGAAALVFVPQVLTWYVATGRLFVRTYPGESFNFLHPHMIESLFWLQPHGLLPYAPVMVFAFLGLIWAWFKRRDIAIPVTVAFLPFWYLVSAWYDWSYADAFGHRGFIDILPILAVPMAFFFGALPRRWMRAATAAIATVMSAATMMLMLAYWQYRIPGDGFSWSGFVLVFRHPLRLLRAPPVPPWFLVQ